MQDSTGRDMEIKETIISILIFFVILKARRGKVEIGHFYRKSVFA